MMEQPLVTVAIPVYNAEKTITWAIKSVLLQSYQNWELLVINDGSKDASMEIAGQFKDARIQIIDDNVNKGLINRLNSIPAIAKGKYLARMDADDIMHPDRLFKQVQYLEAAPQLDVIDCAIYSIDENNKVKGIRNTHHLPTIKVQLLKHCLFTHPAVLGKKEWFAHNRYDSDYYRAEDYELWLRAFDRSKYGRVTIPLLYYRENNVNVSAYISSMKSVRKIIRNHGAGILPYMSRQAELAKSYLKQGIYTLFGAINLQRMLVSYRSNMLSAAENAASNQIIEDIINSSV